MRNRLLTMCVVALILAACGYDDARQSISARRLAVRPGEYAYVTWLHSDRLVVKYAPPLAPGTARHLSDYNFFEVSPTNANWNALARPSPEGCRSIFPGWTARRPDGALVATFKCNRWINSVWHEYDFMYIWDQRLGAWQQIHAYPEQFAAYEFSFAPDSRQLVQTQANGFQQEIYRVTPGQGQTRILPTTNHLDRVRSPNWSARDERVVFIGTNDTPGPNAWLGIFSAKTDGTDVRELVRGVMHLSPIKLSPDGRYIAFGGQYGLSQYSLWIYSLETNRLMRVWSGEVEIDALDWSPDGSNLVLVTVEQQSNDPRWEQNGILILDLDRWLIDRR